MTKVTFAILITLLLPVGLPLYAQAPRHYEPANRGLLGLSSGFITVSSEARIDLDSSLLISSRLHHLSRIPVITEGIADERTWKSCRWMDDRTPLIIERYLTKETGLKHARLLLLVGAYYAFEPGFKKKDIDRGIRYLSAARLELEKIQQPELAAYGMCLLGKCFLKAKNIPRGLNSFREITDNPLLQQNKALQAQAWNYLGLYCPFLPNTIDLRIKSLNRSLNYYMQIGDPENQMNTLMDIAYLSFAGKKLAQAEAAVSRSYQLQIKSRFLYPHYSSDLLTLIAQVKGDYVKELYFALQSVKSAESSKDSLGLAIFYERVGDSYVRGYQTKAEARKWYQKALVQFQKNAGNTQFYRMLIFLADRNFVITDNIQLITNIQRLMITNPPNNTIDQQDADIALAECYRQLKKYRIAEVYFHKAEQLDLPNRLIRGDLNSSVLNYLLGEFYTETGQLKKSKKYFLRVLKDSSAYINAPENLAGAYWALHKIDSASGNYRQAMQYIQKYTILQKTIQNLTKQKLPGHLDDLHHLTNDVKLLIVAANLQPWYAQQPSKILKWLCPVILLCLLLLYRSWQRLRGNLLSAVQKAKIAHRDQLLRTVIQEKAAILHSKERLAKEIHKRVQSNLEIVMGLLNSQSAALSDQTAISAIAQSQSRMKAISLIHERLYMNTGKEYIEMAGYIRDTAAYLSIYFKTLEKIKFVFELEELPLKLVKAEPLGLIINEIITNSIKHAFNNTDEGTILIAMMHSAGKALLRIQDNGLTLAPDFNIATRGRFGFRLIEGLSEQLGARIEFKIEAGLAATITFNYSANADTDGSDDTD